MKLQEMGTVPPRPQLPYRESVSILQPWVQDLLLRQQGTLLAAIRGCDGVPKEDTSKVLMRAIRSTVLVPADERETFRPGGFMTPPMEDDFKEAVKGFVKSMDHYPLHFVSHLMHAFEVIGYEHPDREIGRRYCGAYFAMVDALHLKPESIPQHRERMNEDRIAQNRV